MALDIQLTNQIQHLDADSLEELRLFVAILLQKHQTESNPVDLDGPGHLTVSLARGKFPEDLTPYAIKDENLDALAKIFDEEPSVEELCKMLAT